MITITKKGQFELSKSLICIAITMLVTWQTIAATRNHFGFEKLSLTDAQELADKVESKIPVEVNEDVLKWLNYFMSHPKGKAYMVKSLKRMKIYEGLLKEKILERKMPLELLAVPFIESGYDNSVISMARAVGLWQFIPSTARNYGLQVNSRRDERVNVSKATTAAMDYYADLMSIEKFSGDWRLALMAYNCGESRLLREINVRGTKDPWALKDITDKDYLAKIMASIIVLNRLI